jgi:pilus assembly protein CpaE
MQSLTFVILNNDSESTKEVRDALAGTSGARILAECTSADQMVATITRLRPSAAIVTLKPEHSENNLELIKTLVTAAPDTAIITASRDTSPTLILGSMRAGAREFLQLPTNSSELQTVLGRIAEFCSSQENIAKRTGRIVAVFSGKGGAGVSFFSTNLAAAMPSQTLLIDLNLQAGDTASFLGVDVKYSLTDFVRNRARLDDSLIASLITPHSARLSLVAAPIEAHDAEDIRPEDVTEILHQLSQKFEFIVLDLPHTFDPVSIAALDMVDEILLLLTVDIPGIRSTKRALKVFDRLGYPRQKTHVVVNRWSKNIDSELSKVEAHLGEQLIGLVPNDYRRVMDSINLGRPLIQEDPSSKIAIEIKRIAGLISDNGQKQVTHPRKKSLRSLFAREQSAIPMGLSTLADNA